MYVCVRLACVTTHLYVLMRFLFTNFSGDHCLFCAGTLHGLCLFFLVEFSM